ncbi:hypothetical protein BASA81_000126 [Batrachochytrium salamandrivorans]|nr:hypothetical protein BASA81_000126 [Batrachochytrium salamandrivorans]
MLLVAKNLVASAMLGVGVVCFALPNMFADLFHLHAMRDEGLIELRAYYGGTGIGLGAYLLTCQDARQATLLLKSIMVPLGVTRLLTLLPLRRELLAEQPVACAMHLFALLGVELPMIVLTTLILWLVRFPPSSLQQQEPMTSQTSKWKVLKHLVALLWAAESLLFWVKPVETAEWFGVGPTGGNGEHPFGVSELRSMWAGQRFGFALFAKFGGELQSRLFIAIMFSLSAVFRAIAISLYSTFPAVEGDQGAIPREQLALTAMETAVALLFIRAYAQQRSVLPVAKNN